MTDPIADMLTRIRNASKINHKQVLVPFSQLKEKIARILEKESLVDKVEIIPADKDQKGDARLYVKIRKITNRIKQRCSSKN
ncbi:MAG: 30S ribosomal protein S8 [Candidatus Falkowbacteria bacterium]|nr:30S ribosomal protein S8 [Candidatus Falkowbacteria bacterium]